jgi:ribose-phosphate pyrophosphokinase
MGYARQDRRPSSARVPITAKVVANMLDSVGVDRVLTMDLHSEQIQGFFDIPVDNIYSGPILLGDVWKQNYKNLVVVSPDVGGVVRARWPSVWKPTSPSSTSGVRVRTWPPS